MRKKLFVVGLLVLLLVALSSCSNKKDPPSKDITSIDQYYEIIDSNKAYIYFHKEDCKYCNVFQPILDDLVDESKSNVYYYDIEENDKFSENSSVMEMNGIGTVPKLVEYEDGKVLAYVDHDNNRAEISALLN